MKNILSLTSVLILACLFLPLVTTAQERAPDTQSKAITVYIYRLRDGYAALLKPSVFDDGKQVVRMRNGRFVKLSFTPGPHNITSTFEGSGIAVDLKAGETYYFRVDMSRATFLHAARGQVTQVVEGQGKFEVAQLKLSDTEDFKADTPGDPAGSK
jgi:hypothetical protein